MSTHRPALSGLAYWTAKCQNSRLNIFGDSSQTETSVNDLAALFAEITGAIGCPVYQPARSGDILRSTLRNREVCTALDWQPRIGLSEGLARTYKALRRTDP